jgi:hypothetical protein
MVEFAVQTHVLEQTAHIAVVALLEAALVVAQEEVHSEAALAVELVEVHSAVALPVV